MPPIFIALKIDWPRLFHVPLTKVFAGLSRARRERAKRFLRPQDRYRSALAGHLVAELYHRQRPGAVLPLVLIGAKGKPAFVGANQPTFNLSHSGEWVVGVAGHETLGVDVEKISTKQKILDNVMSPSEKVKLQTLPKSVQKEYFIRLWTLKEAHAKATGDGLNTDFASLSFDLPENGVAQLAGSTMDWLYRSFLLDARHACAICSSRQAVKNPEYFDAVEFLTARLTEQNYSPLNSLKQV